MKKLVGIIFLFSGYVFAASPYDVLLQQFDSTGSFQQTRFIAKPSSDAYLRYNPSTDLPEWGLLSGVAMSSTQISDTSSIGRSLMTAPSDSDARATIGAGTSNFSGAYSALTGRPTNLSQFTNDSNFITLVTAPVTSVNTKTGALTLTASDVGAAVASHTHTASQISDSTTIGRQLVTAANQAAVQSIVGATQVNSDWTASSGVAQILNKPAKYSGSPNTSGIYAVTYGTAYGSTPNVLVTIVGGTNKDSAVLTSTTTGFSVLVERRSDVLGLLPTYAVVNSSSTPTASINVTVTP